jgi:hypothetical protein
MVEDHAECCPGLPNRERKFRGAPWPSKWACCSRKADGDRPVWRRNQRAKDCGEENPSTPLTSFTDRDAVSISMLSAADLP